MTTTIAATPTSAVPDVAGIPKLGHAEAMVLAAAEFQNMSTLLAQLRPDEWTRPTVCGLWDVRAMVAHVVGMADAQASYRSVPA